MYRVVKEALSEPINNIFLKILLRVKTLTGYNIGHIDIITMEIEIMQNKNKLDAFLF